MKQTLHLLFILWAFFLPLHLSAQGFSLSTGYAAQQGSADQEIAPTLNLRNNSGRPLEIRWERQRVNLPEGWEIVICDRQCYTLSTETKSIFLAPGESLSDFRVSFRPNGMSGVGSVEIRFYNPLQRDKEQSVTFSATAQGQALNLHASQRQGTPRIYPNPATEHILLSAEGNDIRFLELYNVVGRKITSFSVQYEGEKFNISDLPKGVYMVRMLDAQHRVVRTQSINKYNP